MIAAGSSTPWTAAAAAAAPAPAPTVWAERENWHAHGSNLEPSCQSGGRPGKAELRVHSCGRNHEECTCYGECCATAAPVSHLHAPRDPARGVGVEVSILNRGQRAPPRPPYLLTRPDSAVGFQYRAKVNAHPVPHSGIPWLPPACVPTPVVPQPFFSLPTPCQGDAIEDSERLPVTLFFASTGQMSEDLGPC